jgi:uncharacterized protein (TIGR02246 family)
MEERKRSLLSRAFVAVVVLAGVALLLGRASRRRAENLESVADVQASIDRANQAYLDALKRGDAAAYAALFTPDAVSMPARGTIMRGREAIGASIAEAFKNVTFRDGRLQSTETRVDGKAAYEAGRYSFDVMSGGECATLNGRYFVVWRKVRDGWKIAVDASQPNAPV